MIPRDVQIGHQRLFQTVAQLEEILRGDVVGRQIKNGDAGRRKN
jgi:hypothetical protein